ncbi:MAG TPA: endonuclease/exonuclease/phosphatase family protein [Nitrospiraceae bacterium]|nr:endonuclease/exonuclease/phosphatase family protein [Nitrospiraceae bacterium]
MVGWWRLLGAWSLLVLCLWGCSSAPPAAESPADAVPQIDTFKILTYNTLHGLLVERFWVRPGELLEQQLARFNLRVEQLAEAQPDVALLQEVNPLPHMAERYVEALQARGLRYSQVHQVDACGLRLPGLALLRNLNNGLVILAKVPLRIQQLDGLKLSGTGSCHDQAGWQLGELRYALIAEIMSPATQSKYLVSTAHLHSGIERDMYFLNALKDAHQQGRIHQYDHLMAVLKGDQELRLRELHTWIKALHRYQENGPYTGLIIGGDFNFEPGSPEYRELERFGLQDTAELASEMPMLNTYDPALNPLAGHEETGLPPEFDVAIATESASDRQEIIADYRRAIGQARRIDFLFSMSFMSKACLKQALFGQTVSSGHLAGSDHYGVINTYSYHMPC